MIVRLHIAAASSRLVFVVLALLCAVSIAGAAGVAGQTKRSNPQVQWLSESAPADFDGFIVYYHNDAQPSDVSSARARQVRSLLDQDLARASNGRRFSISVERRIGTGGHVLKPNTALDVKAANAFMAAMAANPEIESIEPNLRMYPLVLPNDPFLNWQWSLWDAAGGINVEPAWDAGVSGSGVVIAVIDTGQTAHPDLDAETVAGYDMISDPANARDGTGRDNNPADEGDWNTAGQCSAESPGRTSTWHGTHVAGTAAALTNNSLGIAGVAYGSWVQHVRVLGACGGTIADIADGIIWASGGPVPGAPNNATPARVLNLSLGGTGACGTTYQQAINSARSRNSVLLVAAGNESMPASMATPANCTGVVTVASNGPAGARAPYSNYGPAVDVAAPGGDSSIDPGYGILSTVNLSQSTPGTADYGMKDGTSMATPHVAGIAALMISTNPSLTPDQIGTILRNSARPFPSYCLGGCGTGIVDAAAAVAVAGGATLSAYPLSVMPVGNGSGNVTSAPSAINCGAQGSVCSRRFNANTSVTLTATAASGYAFLGWAGTCSGSAPTCTVSMNRGHDVYAVFDYPLMTLTNGVALTGLASPTGAPRYFQIAVPTNATQLKVEISGGSGDADLYVRRGSLPTTQTYDCRPWLYGNTEACNFTNPSAGTWYVMLTGDPDFSGVSLRATYTLQPSSGQGIFCDGMENYPTPCP